jgi:hypothetical protein
MSMDARERYVTLRCRAFDCTHDSALQAGTTKRTTLTWMDSLASGSSRTDVPLSGTFKFSTPLVESISS